VVEAMHQIRSPKCVCGRVSNVVTKSTHLRERATSLITQVADDGLISRVLTTPMASPA
jgi:hypothetical protein